MKVINSFGGAVKISYFVKEVNYDLNYVRCSFFVLGRIVMCSILCFWGYGQIAQICDKGKMFVHIVHADNISD